jgi:Na+-driven multidrug efflux pump
MSSVFIIVGKFSGDTLALAAAALRAVGDSKASPYILTTSGLLNVIFNIIFVTVFDMSVDGVALATAISKYALAIAVIIVLVKRRNECYTLSFRKLRISAPVIKKISKNQKISVHLHYAISCRTISLVSYFVDHRYNTDRPCLAIALKKLLRADFDNVLKECKIK